MSSHHSGSSRHRDHSRSRSRSRSQNDSRRRHRHSKDRSRSRSRSRSPHHPGHRSHHRSSRRSSRSRSRSPHRKHSHHEHHHHRSSRERHASRDRPRVKQENSDHHTNDIPAAASNSHASAAAAATVKSESSHTVPSHIPFRMQQTTPVAVKTTDEPSDAELTAALEAAASEASSAPAPAAGPVLPAKKAEINYGLSGKLASAEQALGEVESKYQEPPDARMPTAEWRLYVFKGKEQLETLRVHRQSSFIFGREEKAVDILVAHPSCSKQHAVLQFRQREVVKPDGNVEYVVKPYLMDLGSTNGTYLMNIRREPHKYYELFENDVFKFGFSTREFVLLNPESAKAKKQ